MSGKQLKRWRRQEKKMRDQHNEDFVDFLKEMPLYYRLRSAKQIIKGNTYGIGITIILISMMVLYSIPVLIFGAFFNEKILTFLEKIVNFVFFS
jgi:hypothetical protein